MKTSELPCQIPSSGDTNEGKLKSAGKLTIDSVLVLKPFISSMSINNIGFHKKLTFETRRQSMLYPSTQTAICVVLSGVTGGFLSTTSSGRGGSGTSIRIESVNCLQPHVSGSPLDPQGGNAGFESKHMGSQ